MAAWEPKADEPVGPKEVLGRRIFTDKIWEGQVGDGPRRFRMDHFYDKEPQSDFSVDRLGRATAEGPIVRRVGHLAHTEADARQPSVPFAGWAACSRQHFATTKCNLDIKQMPLEDGTNPYHAEIIRDEFRGKTGPYAFSTMLRDVFTLQGHLTPPPPRRKPQKPIEPAAIEPDP